jgi:cysteine desulfurase
MKKRIYLDHSATTPLDKRALEKMRPYFSEKFGNVGSLHLFGTEAREAIEKAREGIAKAINAKPAEIFFTSGGTESDNIALIGAMTANREAGKGLATSKIEHHAVLHTAAYLESRLGFKADYLPVSGKGIVELDDVKKALEKKPVLVSVMHANNEIGTIQPIGEIGRMCREKGILFHTDAVQTVGKERIDVEKMNIDMLSASAHKFYGPKGIGFLYKRQGVNVSPIGFGGSHEKGLRSGTENVPGIVGMAEALAIATKEMDAENAHERKLRDRLVAGTLEIGDSWLNGAKEPRLSGNANLGFDFVEGESIVLMLSDRGIAASTGSACSSKSLEPSHVLRAIGLPHVKCHGSLRFSLGRDTRQKDIDFVLQVLPGIVKRLRAMSPLHRGIDLSEFEGEIDERHGHEE